MSKNKTHKNETYKPVHESVTQTQGTSQEGSLPEMQSRLLQEALLTLSSPVELVSRLLVSGPTWVLPEASFWLCLSVIQAPFLPPVFPGNKRVCLC